jgi:hypothetical protein
VQETVTLQAGSYIFIPSTFNAGEVADYEIKITSQEADFATHVTFSSLS